MEGADRKFFTVGLNDGVLDFTAELEAADKGANFEAQVFVRDNHRGVERTA